MSHPEEIVTRFLAAMEAQDHEAVASLLAAELRYTNVSLPTITGGGRVANLIRKTLREGRYFEVQLHSIASTGNTVLTERTDVLKLGPLHVAFWVCGTFEVENGRITVWRDYFDWLDITRGTLRGVAGVALPQLRPTLPTRAPG
ncbi:MAG: limonene-1,2-epoxide hydrolase family protein [Moraxellaceae bacterium]